MYINFQVLISLTLQLTDHHVIRIQSPQCGTITNTLTINKKNMKLIFSGGSIVIIWQALWGVASLGSATGLCHLLDILAEIKVHMRIGRGLVYLPHVLTFLSHFYLNSTLFGHKSI